MIINRTASLVAVTLATLTLAACGTMGTSPTVNTLGQPQPVQPVQTSQVNSAALPPIAGSVVQQDPASIAPGLTGTPVLGGVQQQPLQTASADGSFVTLGDAGTAGAIPPGGRDLTGGLTIEKLLGGWNVTSGADQCRVNLTYTAKAGTSRYRASAPGCAIPGLAAVASWQLTGNQIQLFDEAGSIVAALALSGNRFVGTSAGGQGISMTS